ncbi:MAG: hypothetical protein R2751_18485 [Bacteroidales bacterium]
MNQKRVIHALISCSLLLGSCTSEPALAPNATCLSPDPSGGYEYPLLPGTREWDQLGSRGERVRACQVPEKILGSLSTPALLETVLNYPLILDFYAFSFYQSGFSRIRHEFNGFAELYSRSDLFDVITSYYAGIRLDCPDDAYPPRIHVRHGGSPPRLAMQTLEMLMFQDDFLARLSGREKQQLFQMILRTSRAKLEAGLDREELLVNSALMGKLLLDFSYEPFAFQCIDNQMLLLFVEDVPSLGVQWGVEPVKVVLSAAMDYEGSHVSRAALY